MPEDLDTAPLWFGDYERRLNARLDSLDARLANLEAAQNMLASECALLIKDNRRLDEKINVFVEEVIALSREVRRAQDAA
jgi:hypothetical protein